MFSIIVQRIIVKRIHTYRTTRTATFTLNTLGTRRTLYEIEAENACEV
jgi:hypothetical protein